MRKWKKIGLSLLGGFLGLCALLAGAWLFPFPIEGNWEYRPRLRVIGEEKDDEHSFFRFEKGKIMLMSSEAKFPPLCLGTYQRTGWGKYKAEDENFPGILRSTFLLLTRLEVPNDLTSWDRYFFRDFRISACRKAVNHPSNEWMVFPTKTWLRVTGIPSERMFLSYWIRVSKDQLEAELNCLFKQPLQIYTASNDVPSSVLEALDGYGVGYTIHANQEWVTSDTLKTNPIWRAMGMQTLYGLVITSPSEAERYQNGYYEDFIYVTNGDCLDFEYFKKRIDRHRQRGDVWKKDLRLYVEDGILPEDVRQLFAPFDLEYTVLDDKVLYRGKNKDRKSKKGGTP